MKFPRGPLSHLFRRSSSHVVGLVALAATAIAALTPVAAHAAPPAELKLDYAYYSPESLVIKRNAWLDQELAADHTHVKSLLSLGRNRPPASLNNPPTP